MPDSLPEPRSFAEGFTRALANKRLTLKDLAARLHALGEPIGHSTLSYWRRGIRHPSRASFGVIAAIERILDTPHGALLELAEHGDRTPTVPAFADEESYEGDRFERAAVELFDELGQSHDLLTTVTSMSRLKVSKDHRRGVFTTHKLERATGGVDVDHIVSLLAIFGGAAEPPRITHTAGVTVTREVMHRDGELYGYRLEFADPVRRGELVQYMLTMEVPLIEPVNLISFTRRVREASLVLEFHPDSLPDWVEEFEEGPGHAAPKFHALEGRNSLVAHRSGFGPGVLGQRWGWG